MPRLQRKRGGGDDGGEWGAGGQRRAVCYKIGLGRTVLSVCRPPDLNIKGGETANPRNRFGRELIINTS